jgi:hypothetical protein
LASNRVQAILYTLQLAEEVLGQRTCYTRPRRYLPPHPEDADGEVEGKITLHSVRQITQFHQANDWGSMSRTFDCWAQLRPNLTTRTESLAAHRAQVLSAILPVAIAHGVAEVEPVREPLRASILARSTNCANLMSIHQNYDEHSNIDQDDTDAIFYVSPSSPESFDGQHRLSGDPKIILSHLQASWSLYNERLEMSEDAWMEGLVQHLEGLVRQRLLTVQSWITINTSRFTDADAIIGPLHRELKQMSNDVKASIQMCALKCGECHLMCLQVRTHEGVHDCATDHRCKSICQYIEAHEEDVACRMP